jgi:hypothetical protein
MSRSAYEITRLAFAEVVSYKAIIKDIRSERKYRRMSYEFARDAIAQYHSSEGDIAILDAAIGEVEQLETNTQIPEDKTLAKNNREVLEGYKEHFSNRFRPTAGELPEEFESFSIEINGLRITGKPHLQVRNAKNGIKFIYLLTSKDWTDEQKNFFISLLGEIVAANVHGASARDVEGLDCRTGRKISKDGLGANFRRRVEYLAEHLTLINLA